MFKLLVFVEQVAANCNNWLDLVNKSIELLSHQTGNEYKKVPKSRIQKRVLFFVHKSLKIHPDHCTVLKHILLVNVLSRVYISIHHSNFRFSSISCERITWLMIET